jgi:RNA polymerase sigma factor (sigma-70 family)
MRRRDDENDGGEKEQRLASESAGSERRMRTESEYQKLVEDNHKLIYGFLNKNHLSDDWYGECAVGLCKAARAYDESRGVKFSVLAYRTMMNEVRMRMRTERKLCDAMSFDELVTDESSNTFGHFVPDPYDRLEAQDTIALFEWVIERAKMSDLDIIYRRLQGQSECEIAAARGITRAWVSKRLAMVKRCYADQQQMYCAVGEDDEAERAALRAKIVCCLRERVGTI